MTNFCFPIDHIYQPYLRAHMNEDDQSTVQYHYKHKSNYWDNKDSAWFHNTVPMMSPNNHRPSNNHCYDRDHYVLSDHMLSKDQSVRQCNPVRIHFLRYDIDFKDN